MNINARAQELKGLLRHYGTLMSAECRATIQEECDERMEFVTRGLTEFRAFEESSRHEIEESTQCLMSLHDRFYILQELFGHYPAALQYVEAVAIRQEELKLADLLQNERKWLFDDPAAHHAEKAISSDEESVPVTANVILGRRMQA